MLPEIVRKCSAQSKATRKTEAHTLKKKPKTSSIGNDCPFFFFPHIFTDVQLVVVVAVVK